MWRGTAGALPWGEGSGSRLITCSVTRSIPQSSPRRPQKRVGAVVAEPPPRIASGTGDGGPWSAPRISRMHAQALSHKRTTPSVEEEATRALIGCAVCGSSSASAMGALWPRREARGVACRPDPSSSRSKTCRAPSPPPQSRCTPSMAMHDTPPACNSSRPCVVLSVQMRFRRSTDHRRTDPPSAVASRPPSR